MKIWLLKHRGRTWWGSLCFSREYELAKDDKFWSGEYFLRRKDAVAYRKAYKIDHLEIVSAEVQQSKEDARRSK